MTKSASAKTPRRVGLISLGCAKNLVDAEVMLGTLLKAGIEIVNDPAQADAVIVNTCSFIDSAQEESVDAILESAELREAHHRGQALIVSGCLPQRFREELPALLPEVDAIMGVDQVAEVGRIVDQAIQHRAQAMADGTDSRSKRKSRDPKAELARLDSHKPHHHDGHEETVRGTEAFGRTRKVIRPSAATAGPGVTVHLRPNYVPHHDTPRFRLTPAHFAYVKIAEGCNHPCSFCIIPRMRGSHRSRTQADVVEEARRLVGEGVKELNLISQDSTYYGLDLRPNHSRAIASPDRFAAATRSLPSDSTTICSLLRELDAIPGDFWIRLLYTHPAHWTDELIRTIAGCRKVARYIDMPLQHIHDDILTRMRRETTGGYIRELIGRIRTGIPGVAIRTTFIVGFPGETDRHFKTLLEFIRETRFERLGVFAYSREDGTISGRMERQVGQAVRERRRAEAMATQQAISREHGSAMVGRQLRVLGEKEATARELQSAQVSSWEHGLIRNPESGPAKLGRSVYVVARSEADAPDIDGRVYVRGGIKTGEFATVRVVAHTDYDLVAEK